MSSALRRVCKARLRAPNEDRIRHGLVLLEDAVRTASIPHADGAGMLVVRSLAIGRFRADASSATVALAIESAVNRIASSAVHATHPSAQTAPAVFFHDDAEPFILLARKLARSEACHEWFWKSTLQTLPISTSRVELLRYTLRRVTETSAGPAAGVRLVRELIAHDAGDALLRTLQPQDGRTLLRAFGWPTQPMPRGVDTWTPPPKANARAVATLRRWILKWSPADARSLWLGCVVVADAQPALLTHPTVTARAAALVQQTVVQTLAPAVHAGTSVPRPRAHPQAPPQPAAQHAAREHEAQRAVAPLRKRKKEEVDETNVRPQQELLPSVQPKSNPIAAEQPVRVEAIADTRETAPEADVVEAPAAVFWQQPTLPSAHAGFLLLIALMSRLGAARVLNETPTLLEANWPVALLHTLARALRVPFDDPAVAALTPDGQVVTPSAEHRALTARWIRSMRSWCKDYGEITLRELVRRPGRIAATATHIDVYFDLRFTDIRIRKAGIDFDPGWVPWLMRVIQYHYEQVESADAE